MHLHMEAIIIHANPVITVTVYVQNLIHTMSTARPVRTVQSTVVYK